MPPSPDEKTPGQDNNQKPIDLDSILLPKKETGPNPESAQRVNAGALLAQESSAELPKPEPKAPERLSPQAPAPAAPPPLTMPTPPPAPVVPAPAPVVPPAAPPPMQTVGAAPTPAPESVNVAPFAKPASAPPAPSVPPATPTPAPSEGIRPLQTYKGDLERVVVDKGVSVVSIAAAEAERRGKQPHQETPEDRDARGKTYLMVGVGLLLLLIAGGVLAAIFTRDTTVPVAAAPNAPFLSVDDAVIVPIPSAPRDRDAVMTNLTATRQRAKLSLGLVQWFYLEEPPAAPGMTARQIGIQELLGILAPRMPQELARVLDEEYFLGIHSFDENQAFLILKVDSYEVAYRAMLDWERTLRNDLLPLFSRNPSPHLGEVPQGGTTTPQFIQTDFVDRVVENRDTRAYQNDNGDLLLLWTFLGRNLVLITTNEFTLREVVSRLSSAPVVPQPTR